jgi:hypothetical protein
MRVNYLCRPVKLVIEESSFDDCTVFHLKNTLAVLAAHIVLTFVCEKSVVIVIYTFSMA